MCVIKSQRQTTPEVTQPFVLLPSLHLQYHKFSFQITSSNKLIIRHNDHQAKRKWTYIINWKSHFFSQKDYQSKLECEEMLAFRFEFTRHTNKNAYHAQKNTWLGKNNTKGGMLTQQVQKQIRMLISCEVFSLHKMNTLGPSKSRVPSGNFSWQHLSLLFSSNSEWTI